MDFNASTLNSLSVIRGENIIYQLTDVLGQGSFGITYKATIKTLAKGAFGEDWVDTNTYKAVKEFYMRDINSRDDTGFVRGFIPGGISSYYAEKFYKEAHNLAKMRHPNIIKVTDFIEANNTYYYAMDYIEGDNLNHYLEKHKLSEEEAISIIKDVASALQYMHEEHRMLHLDLKPGNIMRSKDGHIYVIDFGLSKHFNEQGEPDTSTTIGYGTEGYAPLEQGKKTHKSNDFFPTIDVYALGGTFFKLLTGETPPPSSDVLEDETLLGSIMERHHVNPRLQEIIITAMAPSSKRRMQSVGEFRNALSYYLGETKLFSNTVNEEKTVAIKEEEIKEEPAQKETPQKKTTKKQYKPIRTKLYDPKNKMRKLWLRLTLIMVACFLILCFIIWRSNTYDYQYKEWPFAEVSKQDTIAVKDTVVAPIMNSQKVEVEIKKDSIQKSKPVKTVPQKKAVKKKKKSVVKQVETPKKENPGPMSQDRDRRHASAL